MRGTLLLLGGTWLPNRNTTEKSSERHVTRGGRTTETQVRWSVQVHSRLTHRNSDAMLERPKGGWPGRENLQSARLWTIFMHAIFRISVNTVNLINIKLGFSEVRFLSICKASSGHRQTFICYLSSSYISFYQTE